MTPSVRDDEGVRVAVRVCEPVAVCDGVLVAERVTVAVREPVGVCEGETPGGRVALGE